MLLSPAPCSALEDPSPGRVETDHVVAELLAEADSVRPGTNIDLALVFDIRPHWHTYWKNPGDSGEPPRIEWTLPDGVTAGPIQWLYPELIRVGPLANYGYSGRAVHLIPLSVAGDWPLGTPIDLQAHATWLVCEEHCIPEEGTFRLRLETRDTAAAASTASGLFVEARAKLPAPGHVAAEIAHAETASGQAVMRLRVPIAALGQVPDSAAFFADHWGLIEHAAPQPWEIDETSLILSLTPGVQAHSTASTGLLVVEAQGAPQAFQIEASVAAAGGVAETVGPSVRGVVGLTAEASVGDAQASLGLPLALLFALLGGLVLNLMPCVFPVLAIKALSLSQQGTATFRHRALHGLAYTAGVLSLFALISLLLIGLRAGGAALGWGFQLQSPVFVVLMLYLFLTLGLSFAGALTLGTGLMGIGGAGLGRSHLGAFATGALAALVAAPCTAPFMGAALGYALVQPWQIALAVVLMLGLGMALPFLVLALSPALARRLPRPGRWMETLKQLLAFPMFATAAWLLWVLSQQVGASGIGAALAGAVLLVFGLWVLEASREAHGAWGRVGKVSAAASLAAVFGLIVWVLPADPVRRTEPATSAPDAAGLASVAFTSAGLAEARAVGRPVFVNMTAAWCITCLVNERVALERPAVVEAFADQDVLYLKGDWTNRDGEITEYLAGYGRNGVPLYVYYAPNQEPKVLPQLLTESIVLDVLGP
jgi:thiol:disulfide interchange protein DsbD